MRFTGFAAEFSGKRDDPAIKTQDVAGFQKSKEDSAGKRKKHP
ncbi:MAG: hypothetical protein ACLU7V_05740 [Anaerovoracaceae bacterium]